jgi:hypothetical protein
MEKPKIGFTDGDGMHFHCELSYLNVYKAPVYPCKKWSISPDIYEKI